jgi:hypothetical protein
MFLLGGRVLSIYAGRVVVSPTRGVPPTFLRCKSHATPSTTMGPGGSPKLHHYQAPGSRTYAIVMRRPSTTSMRPCPRTSRPA